MAQLFDSLKTHPVIQGDEIRIEQAFASQAMAYSKLYPNIDLFGRYDYASTATGMLPVSPNDLMAMVKDPSVGQPFSENIFRMGATISMPIFVASIFPMAAKAKMMARSAEDLKTINLLKNEAVLVGANANLLYMEALDKALVKKKTSMLKTKEFVDASNRHRILDTMSSQGISSDRIELRDGHTTPDWLTHMAYYDRLDVALDPVGGMSGATTTCEALWMGLPVIAREGDRMASRMSASILNAIGRPEWIAHSDAEYIDKVVALARGVEARKALRSKQRKHMAASPLCDARGLAKALEDAYEAMFHTWWRRR